MGSVEDGSWVLGRWLWTPGTRLVVELPARTGKRAGELAGLQADSGVQIG